MTRGPVKWATWGAYRNGVKEGLKERKKRMETSTQGTTI